jgi:hypothetical protein
MPFAVFRRHSKKLLAVFAILSMIGFVLSDSLPALLRAGNESHRTDTVIAELYGKEVRRSDLAQLSTERSLANAFMASLVQRVYGFPRPQLFGDTDVRSLVDAYILQHKAEKLGMPNSADLAREWLRQLTGGQMDAQLFELVLAPFRNQSQVTGEQMLYALANQIRLMNVRELPGVPDVTPLDIYQAYRDRNELVSVNAVRIPVADFIGQVSEPTNAEVQAFYDRYKNVPANPKSPTPGFKIPRQVQVEFVSTDAEALAREFRAKLTEQELLDYYETRKSEIQFQLPPLETLPITLFEDDPQNKLTPPPAKLGDLSPELVPDTSVRYRPFAEVRTQLELDLSHEKAREAIDRMFSAVRDAMYKFSDVYNEVVDENKEKKLQGDAALKAQPPRPDLRPIAKQSGLTLETSPLLSKEAAANYGEIGQAHVGFTRAGDRTFVDEMFSMPVILFEPIDLMNEKGRAFLAWKIADNPPHVPPLAEIRPEVVYFWKLEQARPLAQKAADEIAAKARQAGGTLTIEIAGSRPIFATAPLAKLEASMLPMPGQFSPLRPRPTEIPEIADPSDELRDLLFELEPGEVAVAADMPKSHYYVMALNKRYPVSYVALYGSTGQFMEMKVNVLQEARERLYNSWMDRLRTEAGLKPDWSPPEEAEVRISRRGDR